MEEWVVQVRLMGIRSLRWKDKARYPVETRAILHLYGMWLEEGHEARVMHGKQVIRRRKSACKQNQGTATPDKLRKYRSKRGLD